MPRRDAPADDLCQTVAHVAVGELEPPFDLRAGVLHVLEAEIGMHDLLDRIVVGAAALDLPETALSRLGDEVQPCLLVDHQLPQVNPDFLAKWQCSRKVPTTSV